MPLMRHLLVAVSERLYTLYKTLQHADYQANGHYSSAYRLPVKHNITRANIDTLTRYTHACGIKKTAIALY